MRSKVRAVNEAKVRRTHFRLSSNFSAILKVSHRILQLNMRSRVTLSSTGEIEEKLWGLWPLAASMNHACRRLKKRS